MATLPKAFWSSRLATSLSRSGPALASISARNRSTSGRAAGGGGSPVRRSRTMSETISSMGGLAWASIGLNAFLAQD